MRIEFKKASSIISTLCVLVLAFVYSNSQAQNNLYIYFNFNVDDGKAKEGQVIVYENGEKKRTLPGSKKMEYELEFDSEYILEFQHDGYITKKISFSTAVPSERKQYEFVPFGFNMTIFPQMDEVNTVIFNQPVAKVNFSSEMDDFDYDTDYTKSVQSQMREAEAQIKEIQETGSLSSGGGGGSNASSSQSKKAIEDAIKKAENAMAQIDDAVKQSQELSKGLENGPEKNELINLMQKVNVGASEAKTKNDQLKPTTPEEKALNLSKDVVAKATDVVNALQNAKDFRKQIDEENEKKKAEELGNKKAAQDEIAKAQSVIAGVMDEVKRLKKVINDDPEKSSHLKLAVANAEQDLRDYKSQLGTLGSDPKPGEALNLSQQVIVNSNDLIETLKQKEQQYKNDKTASANNSSKSANQKALDEAESYYNDALDAFVHAKKRAQGTNSFPDSPVKENLQTKLTSFENTKKSLDDENGKLTTTDPSSDNVLNLSQQVIVNAKDLLKEADEINELITSLNDENAGKKELQNLIQKALAAVEGAERRRSEFSGTMGSDERIDVSSIQDDYDAVTAQLNNLLNQANSLSVTDSKENITNLSQQIVVKSNDAINTLNDLNKRYQNQKSLSASKNAIEDARNKARSIFEESLKRLQEANDKKIEMNNLPLADDYVDILLEKANKIEQQAQADFNKLDDDQYSKDDIMRFSQSVLLKAKEVLEMSEDAIKNIDHLMFKFQSHQKVIDIIKEAEESVLIAEASAKNSKLIVNEMDVDGEMVALISAAKHAEFQSKKARHFFEEMSTKMPLERAERMLQLINYEKDKALANGVLCEDERRRIEGIMGSDTRTGNAKMMGSHFDPKSSNKNAFDDKIVEELQDPRKKTKIVTITRGGNEIIYKKVKHSWGGVYYFKDQESISVLIFQQETGEN